MKRYFLPLLLASTCVGGCVSKGWAMMGKNDPKIGDPKIGDPKKGLSNSMMNLGIFLNQNAKPSLTPQYPLTGEALRERLADLEKNPHITDPSFWELTEKERIAMNSYSFQSSVQNYDDDSKFIKSKIESHEDKNTEESQLFSLESILKTIEEKGKILREINFFLESHHSIYEVFQATKPKNPGRMAIDGVKKVENILNDQTPNQCQEEKRKLYHSIVSAFVTLFDFLGTDFSQHEWDTQTLSNWIEYSDEYLNPFEKLLKEKNLSSKDFPAFLKLLEIRTDMDLEKNLRNKDKVNQQVWNLLIEDTLKNYKEAQALEKIIKLFLDGHILLEKQTNLLFSKALKGLPSKDLIPIAYDLVQNPSLKSQTLEFLNKAEKSSQNAEGAWLLYLDICIKKDFFQKPVRKKGQPLESSPFEQYVAIEENLGNSNFHKDLFQTSFILEQRRKTKESLKLYEYLELQGMPEATLRLCILKLKKENLKKEEERVQTIAALEQLLEQKPDAEGSWILSQAFLDAGDTSKSIHWLLKAEELGHPEAVALLKKRDDQKQKSEPVLIVSPDLEKAELTGESTQKTSEPVEEHKEPEKETTHEVINFQEMIPEKNVKKEPEPDAASVAPSHVTGATQSSISRIKSLLLKEIVGVKDWDEIENYDPETQGKIAHYNTALNKALAEREARKAARAKIKELLDNPAFKESQAEAQHLITTLTKTPKAMTRKDVWKELTELQKLGAQCGVEVILPTQNHVHKFSFKNTIIGNTLEEGEFSDQENLNPQEEKKENKKPTPKKKKDDENGITSAHTKHTKDFKTLDFGFKGRLVEILKKVYFLD